MTVYLVDVDFLSNRLDISYNANLIFVNLKYRMIMAPELYLIDVHENRFYLHLHKTRSVTRGAGRIDAVPRRPAPSLRLFERRPT